MGHMQAIRQAHPKPKYIRGVRICGCWYGPFYCDLAHGHVDNHQAHTADGTELLAEWTQEGRRVHLEEG